MKLIPVSAGDLKGDGGALFSVIPKVMWNKVMPCDEDNFVKATLRCLYVETDDRKIIIETGTGDHYDEKHRKNHGLGEKSRLVKSLSEIGIHPDEITDVLLTHLHWDHFNGSVINENGRLSLTFRNAAHWCSLLQWEHSQVSNAREKVAYYQDLLKFVKDSGKLRLLESEQEIITGIRVRLFNGHTPGQMIPFIGYRGKTIVYMSDFIPTSANIPLVWLASYDLFPVTTLEEKEAFLTEAAENDYILFFEHDYYTECATVALTNKGFVMKKGFNLEELVS